MKKIIILFLLLNFGRCQYIFSAVTEFDERAIYIVRHAEKVTSENDPQLTKAGQERAQKLKGILETKNIEAVYTSDTKRTRNTILPFADEKGLYLQIYDPGNHLKLLEKLLQEKGNSVVVGHSNTVHKLVNLIMEKELLTELDESDYENIFIVYINQKGESRLEKKKYSDFE